MFSPLVEIFSQGTWAQLSSLKDPELRTLAWSSPHMVLLCRADSRTKKYLHAFGRWKEWAERKKEVTVFPVQDVQFAFYIKLVADSTKSRAAVEVAVKAIS